MPGDPPIGPALSSRIQVSIHARHQCRAIRWPGSSHADAQSVSIHARHQCRAIPAKSICTNAFAEVSIHARHQCRAIHRWQQLTVQRSSVSIHARHQCRAIPVRFIGQLRNISFNPRPASMPGDPIAVAGLPAFVLVSIHARHQCRAIRDRPLSAYSRWFVSIHARHQCRAIRPEERGRPGRSLVSIHARHQCRAIHQRSIQQNKFYWFQSTPGINAGRSALVQRLTLRLSSFNPRPASMPGDPRSFFTFHQPAHVSIHARHQCRAIPKQQGHPHRITQVSIHARHQCRAIHAC